jgi:hypothetical protein
MKYNKEKKITNPSAIYISKFGTRYGRYMYNMSIDFEGREEKIKQWIAEGFAPVEIYLLTREKE